MFLANNSNHSKSLLDKSKPRLCSRHLVVACPWVEVPSRLASEQKTLPRPIKVFALSGENGISNESNIRKCNRIQRGVSTWWGLREVLRKLLRLCPRSPKGPARIRSNKEVRLRCDYMLLNVFSLINPMNLPVEGHIVKIATNHLELSVETAQWETVVRSAKDRSPAGSNQSEQVAIKMINL